MSVDKDTAGPSKAHPALMAKLEDGWILRGSLAYGTEHKCCKAFRGRWVVCGGTMW